MKRIFKTDDGLNIVKYRFKKEYDGFYIMEEVCPTGFVVHQSYAILGFSKPIIIDSYMNMCMDEILDAIDEYSENGLFDFHVIPQQRSTGEVYLVHKSGKVII